MRGPEGNGQCGLRLGATTATLEPDSPALMRARTEAEPVGADPLGAQADHRLATRCVAGEVTAWEELYAQCHAPLCVAIRVMLGRRKNDQNLVDEIAARVWYRFVDNDGELLARYSPARGARLITFMRALAKDELCRSFRAELRRRNRESIALQACPRREESHLDVLRSDLRYFVATLTPQEQAFYREVLLGETGIAENVERTKANAWQLTHRIHKKLLRFLGR